MDRIFEEIQFVKGVGPQRSKLLRKLEIETVFDLLWNVPRAYFNRNKVEKIATLSDGAVASIRGRVVNISTNRTRRGFQIFKAIIEDDSGMITAVWFNQPYLSRQLKSGQEIFLSGKVKSVYGVNEISVTEYEVMDGEEQDFSVVPIYHLTGGLNQKTMRKIMVYALNNYLPSYPEILDEGMKSRYNLCDIQLALQNIHFPASGEAFLQARRRLSFEELLLFKLSLMIEKTNIKTSQGAIVHRPQTDLVARVTNGLPFTLTAAQQQVVNKILGDMEAPATMNRLLQGDVGSGKTVVAALAMGQAVASGYQAAIMAPTEILAEQHFYSINRFFAPTSTVVARLTGGTAAGERRMILESAASGEIDILVGTHALIQDEVRFKKLGLVVIDEQHRFGVKQRAKLSNKGETPDVLVMTATPIPRTLALTLYGDLNVSVIDELPPGRRMVKTKYIPRSSRHQAYRFIRTEIEKGLQAYVVCPLVEDSEKQDLQAAVTLYEELKTGIYPDLKVGLLHGRMKASEKEFIMTTFKTGQIDILVATTIVEVGVDVKNASVMLIEHAERFGLSQLHQLRGRVGRGSAQSYCFLIGEPKTDEATRRLQAMEKTSNGFELANEDLLIRGPGDFWGVKQHGLNELKVANLLRDQKIIAWASEAAIEFKLEASKQKAIDYYIAQKFKKSAGIARN
ncbi:MAG: ATP-dependent DNA helicase RecG [Syntrophomonas sp.]|nr:ATP-dependent DNA helicase RecG [Syntrophomonas sp.]